LWGVFLRVPAMSQTAQLGIWSVSFFLPAHIERFVGSGRCAGFAVSHTLTSTTISNCCLGLKTDKKVRTFKLCSDNPFFCASIFVSPSLATSLTKYSSLMSISVYVVYMFGKATFSCEYQRGSAAAAKIARSSGTGCSNPHIEDRSKSPS
jgi:hypothetical protein